MAWVVMAAWINVKDQHPPTVFLAIHQLQVKPAKTEQLIPKAMLRIFVLLPLFVLDK